MGMAMGPINESVFLTTNILAWHPIRRLRYA